MKLNKNLTVKALKAKAKERGMKRYSRLGKAELVQLLNHSHIMDEPIPNIGIAALIPTPVRKIMREIATQTTYNIEKWINSKIVKPITKTVNAFKDEVMKLYYYHPKLKESAAKGWFQTYEIRGGKYDIESFAKIIKSNVIKLFQPLKKVKIILECVMYKPTGIITTAFSSNIETILESTNVDELYDVMIKRIKENLSTFNSRGSGWTFKSIVKMGIHIDKYKPLKGSSYIDLPRVIKDKKAIINPKNKDNECFRWAVLMALYPSKIHANRISNYTGHINKLSWEGMEFPATPKSIEAFEKVNPDIGVTVFAWNGKSVYPWRQSPERSKMINLFLISDEEKTHYTCVKNLSRLLSSQINNQGHAKHFCLNCVQVFKTKNALNNYRKWCLMNEGVAMTFPNIDEKVKFNSRNYCRKMRVPFTIYADFECFIKLIHCCEPNSLESYTNQYQRQEPSGYGYYIVSVTGECQYKSYTKQSEDDNIGEMFIRSLERDIKKLYNKHKFPKKMKITASKQESFNNEEICHICEEKLNGDKVRDHCHLTGNYRGAAHNVCNTQYKIPKFYPVFKHNLSGYDAHLFIKNLKGKINCIPNTEEKYISFSEHIVVGEFIGRENKKVEVKREIRFLDSLKFMSSSLASLVRNLKRDDFKHLRKRYTNKQLDLLLRKGVFPYDYFNDESILDETPLPPIEKFYSTLSGKGISKEDYEHAQAVWKDFNIKTFREYHDVYLESDVLQLTDVFENFRNVCNENYKLDPAWYYTAPGLSWDAMLKITKLELDPITDIDQALFLERGITGGVSVIIHRYAKANNKYIKHYDSKKDSSYVVYLDANNLYGWAMSKDLPVGNFKWMDEENFTQLKEFPPSFFRSRFRIFGRLARLT